MQKIKSKILVIPFYKAITAFESLHLTENISDKVIPLAHKTQITRAFLIRQSNPNEVSPTDSVPYVVLIQTVRCITRYYFQKKKYFTP